MESSSPQPSPGWAEAKTGFFGALEAKGLSERTLVNYREALDQFLGYVLAADPTRALQTIGPDDVRGYLRHLRDLGRSDNTCQNRYRTLRNFFNWCRREKLLKVSPVQGVLAPIVRPQAVQPYTLAEVRAMMLAARRWPELALRDEAILALLYNSGMRAGELCTLKAEHVRESPDGQAAVLVTGKGKRQRWLALEPTTHSLLLIYMATRSPSRYVFSLSVSGLYRLVRRLAWAACPHVANAYVHRFRDTFAVEFLEAGGDIEQLQVILGHASIETTLRYVMYRRQQRAMEAQRRFAPFARLSA